MWRDVLRELGIRLYIITWPLWSPFHLAWIGDWYLIPFSILSAPILFPIGLVLHVLIMICNVWTFIRFRRDRKKLKAVTKAVE